MQIKIEDRIELLIPNCNKEWIKEMDSSKVPAKKESRLDKYFYKHHDNTQYELKDSWGEKSTLEFNYKAIKIWELKKSLIIDEKLEGYAYEFTNI